MFIFASLPERLENDDNRLYSEKSDWEAEGISGHKPETNDNFVASEVPDVEKNEGSMDTDDAPSALATIIASGQYYSYFRQSELVYKSRESMHGCTFWMDIEGAT